MDKKSACVALILSIGILAVAQTGQPDSISIAADGTVRIETPNLIVNGVEYAMVPPGAIIMWSGLKVPDGWVLCDGATYADTGGEVVTPDLSGRFIVGYAPEDGDDDHDYHSLGAVGGEETHALTKKEMPSHSHVVGKDGSHRHSATMYNDHYEHGGNTTESNGKEPYDSNHGTFAVYTSTAPDHDHSIGATGENAAHENRPPYYVLAYIMKIKGKGSNTVLPHD